MNRISTSALDLIASALAAIMLLYVVTLKEVLIYPKSPKEKRSIWVSLKLKGNEREKCTLGLYVKKRNSVFFPEDRKDGVDITPSHMGSDKYDVILKAQHAEVQHFSLIVFLRECEDVYHKPKEIEIGSYTARHFTAEIRLGDVVKKLNLQEIQRGQIQKAWVSYP